MGAEPPPIIELALQIMFTLCPHNVFYINVECICQEDFFIEEIPFPWV